MLLFSLLASITIIIIVLHHLFVSRSAAATVTLFIISSATTVTALSAVSVVVVLTTSVVVVVIVVSALVASGGVATSPVGDLVVIVGGGLAHESHGVLDLLDSGFGLFIDGICPLTLQAGVLLTLQKVLVARQLRFSLDLLHFASYFKRVTEHDQALVDVFELLDFRGWRDLKRAELLDVGVFKADTALFFVVEGTWATAVALLLALDLLEGVEVVAVLTFILGLGDLYFTLLHGVFETLFADLF